MDRRQFMFLSSGAAAGTLIAPSLAQGEQPGALTGSGLATGMPKPLRYNEVPGFLSAAQITPHHTAHYGGALKGFLSAEAGLDQAFRDGGASDLAAFERLKQIQSSRGNSVLLHELYFDGVALKANPPRGALRHALDQRFGSVERWAQDFAASAKSAAGWAMLVVHPINGRLYNVVSDEHAQGLLLLAAPLIVIDCYEHAFYIDYQNRKAEYVEKFLSFIDWGEADRRMKRAIRASP